jgi:hypothetical protein
MCKQIVVVAAVAAVAAGGVLPRTPDAIADEVESLPGWEDENGGCNLLTPSSCHDGQTTSPSSFFSSFAIVEACFEGGYQH